MNFTDFENYQEPEQPENNETYVNGNNNAIDEHQAVNGNYHPEAKVFDIDEVKWQQIKAKLEVTDTPELKTPQKDISDSVEHSTNDFPKHKSAEDYNNPDLEILPTDSIKERIKKRQARLNLWDEISPREGPPEAKSTYPPTSGGNTIQQFLTPREDLLKAPAIPDGPVKDRLILSWLSFAHRIAKREGAIDMLGDVELFSQWFSGSSYAPFRHSTDQAWREAIENYLPVKIIATRSFVFALEEAKFFNRLREGIEHSREIIEKSTPLKTPDGRVGIEAFYDWIGRIMRISNDFATEFYIKPPRSDSQNMISMYSSMYRDAVRQFYTFEEALTYKNSQVELQNDFIRRHPTLAPPLLRPISAMYSERSEWSPIRALAEYRSADIIPFLDLSEIRHGISGGSISRPGEPVKKIYTPWQGVFDVMAKECGYVLVKGEPNEYRNDKRELYRTLIGANTVLGEMLEYLVHKTSFKGDFVLKIDPLLNQIKGKKALMMDISQAYYFARAIAELEREKRINPPWRARH